MQAEAPVTPEQEWSPAQLAEALRGSLPPALLDVRDRHQAAICALPDSLNVPLSELRGSEQAASLCRDAAAQGRPLVVLCRRGIDSQRALQVSAAAAAMAAARAGPPALDHSAHADVSPAAGCVPRRSSASSGFLQTRQ